MAERQRRRLRSRADQGRWRVYRRQCGLRGRGRAAAASPRAWEQRAVHPRAQLPQLPGRFDEECEGKRRTPSSRRVNDDTADVDSGRCVQSSPARAQRDCMAHRAGERLSATTCSGSHVVVRASPCDIHKSP